MGTATVRVLRGLTDTEYDSLKASAKMFGLDVNIRIHRQHYAWGSVDIRPTKKQAYRWTPEQFEKARAFVQAQNLTDSGCGGGFDGEHAAYVYAAGFNYLRREVAR